MSPNAGGGGEWGSQPMRTALHITWHGAQINFGDPTPYLTYGCTVLQHIEGKNTSCLSNLLQMERKLTKFKIETMAKTKNVGRWICSQKHNFTTSLQNSKPNLMEPVLFVCRLSSFGLLKKGNVDRRPLHNFCKMLLLHLNEHFKFPCHQIECGRPGIY